MLRYTVEDMTCGHCVEAIKGAITDLDATAQVTVDLAAKIVDVETSATPNAVSAAIRDAGYTPAPNGAAPAGNSCCGHCH